jgi:hypothetical protein
MVWLGNSKLKIEELGSDGYRSSPLQLITTHPYAQLRTYYGKSRHESHSSCGDIRHRIDRQNFGLT